MKIIANSKLLNEINHLPNDLSKDLEDYVNYLMEISNIKETVSTETKNSIALLAPPRYSNERGYGSMKGLIKFMADDFDAPLEDFKDYM